jgi:outer membrane protein
MKKTALLLGTLFLLSPVYSQSPGPDSLLTPEEAVRLALEANYDIRLARSEAEIARTNNTRANAGMLPTVDLLVDETFTLSAFQQTRANGDKLEDVGVPVNSASAAVQLNWTLFDGRRMFIAKRRLEAVESLGRLNLQASVEQTTADVLQAYYDIVRGRLQERALNEVIVLNEERLRIAEARLAAGFAAQTDALQARIDLNQRRADLLNQQVAIEVAKRALNRLLVRPPQTQFEVPDTLAVTYVPVREMLLANLRSSNATLLSLQKSAEVAALLVDESRTLNKPRIVGIGEFGLDRTDNPAGFALNNNQAGLTVGARLSVPLYTGGNLRRQVEVARLEAEQAVIRVDAQRLAIEAALDDQIAFFNIQQQVLALEAENVRTAREALNISTERFRLGQTDALEVQAAQNSLEQALARRNLVLYNQKIAEIQLQLLAPVPAGGSGQ